MLETLFDVRAAVYDIHDVIFCPARTTMPRKPKKRTAEERAAELARREDLDRRLRDAIERYRVLNVQKRAAAEGS